MNQTRYCQVKGHQENNITYLCTYNECKLGQKWVCVDCIIQQIHNHGQTNQNHLMKQQQFLDLIKKQLQPMLFQKQEDLRLIQICIKEFQYLILSTQFLIKSLEEDLAAIQKNYDLQEIQEIINITKNNYFLLECQQIEKIININYQSKIYEQNLKCIKITNKTSVRSFKVIKKQFQARKVQIEKEMILDKQIIQPNAQLIYQRHFEYKQESSIYTSQISYDEKYLESQNISL